MSRTLPIADLSPLQAAMRVVSASELAVDPAELVALKRKQRNQRRAAAMNIVALARVHDGRPCEICSDHDADMVHAIEDILEVIAGGKPTPLDPLFKAGATASPREASENFERAVAKLGEQDG